MADFEISDFPWCILLVSTLIVIFLFIMLSCVLHLRSRSTSQLIMDNNPKPMKKGRFSDTSMRIVNSTFRRFSLGGRPVVEDHKMQFNEFSSDDLPLNGNYRYSCRNETLVEITEKFDSKLKIDQKDAASEAFLDVLDSNSYVSKLSRNSFYSTSPHGTVQLE